VLLLAAMRINIKIKQVVLHAIRVRAIRFQLIKLLIALVYQVIFIINVLKWPF
jgi:hypothetical protein